MTKTTLTKIGTIGYCMGGPIVFRTAAAVPDRVGAAATFHGGGLVTDQPDSPHLLIPSMKAQFLLLKQQAREFWRIPLRQNRPFGANVDGVRQRVERNRGLPLLRLKKLLGIQT